MFACLYSNLRCRQTLQQGKPERKMFACKPANKLYDGGVDPQPTTVVGPLKLRIADDIRLRIERGELAAGDSLPTLEQLCEQWHCSANPAREAIALLKQQGLITTGQGKPPVVRAPVPRVVRSSERHQGEKDLVRGSDAERRNVGVADRGVTSGQLVFSARYDVIEAGSDLARVFNVSPGTSLLRRVYEMSDPRSKRRQACSDQNQPRPPGLDERTVAGRHCTPTLHGRDRACQRGRCRHLLDADNRRSEAMGA
jgi:GntR family transcriptional regulator